jgi:hypothetical protein
MKIKSYCQECQQLTTILEQISGGGTWVDKPTIYNGCDDEFQIWIILLIKNNNECYWSPESAENSLLYWKNN